MDRPNIEGTRAPPDRESGTSSPAGKRLRIVTRCSTIDELIATFGPYADETSLFIVTPKPRAVGLQQQFVIQLKDGETVMRGEVEVITAITDGTGPDGRNGMRLKLLTGDDATRAVLKRLHEHALAKHAQTAITARPPAPDAPAKEPAPIAKSPSIQADPSPANDAPKPPAAPATLPAPATAPAPAALLTLGPTKAASDDAPPPSRGPADLAAGGDRAPGSTYQLPANPFEGITAEALESFIECTLYEERVPRPSEADPYDAPPPSRSGASLSSFPMSVVSAPPTLAPAGSPAFPPLPALPPPPPAGVPAIPPPPPTFGIAPPAAPVFGPPPEPVAPPAPAPVTPPRGRAGWIAATAIVSSIASLAAAYAIWGRSPEGGSAVPATAMTTVAIPERTGAPPATVTPTATATATPTAAPSVPMSKRECKANVRSYPQGATITWNGEPLGTTPLADVPVPCGPAKVTFDLTGYEHGERSAGAVVGKTAGVFLRLVATLVPVEVTSTPPGAQILVDGRTVGRTPASISMFGMREATVAIALPRYKPWSTKFTPEPPKGAVHADLEKR